MSSSRQAQQLRQRAVERLQRAMEAESALSFCVVGPPDRRVMTNMVFAGDHDMRKVVERYRDKTPPTGSSLSADEASAHARRRGWTLEAPLPTSFNRFDDTARGFHRPVEELDHLEIVSEYRRPLRIAQEYRALIYDRGRFVAWIGGLRRGRGAFNDEQRAAADRLLPSLRRDLRAAATLDALPDVSYVLVGGDGKIRGGSDGAAAWLDERRGSRLGSLVRAAEHRSTGRPVIDGVELDIVLLHDGGSLTQALVVLRPAPGIDLTCTRPLPPRQRQIAALWVGGRSISEIADALAISSNTVKFHLKGLYVALGVSSRHELAALWTARRSAPHPRG
jgi:DNA-binding CsgD family transcriptional regulator